MLDDGTVAQGGVILTGDASIADPVPVMQQSMIGNIKHPYPNSIRGFIFGKSVNVDNARVDLWQGPTAQYVFPLVPQQMQIVSTSANDTSNGSGAQYVMIHYLDDKYDSQTEVIALSGLTPALTVATNILRINGMHVTKVGTVNGSSAGNISLQDTGGTITYSYLPAGENLARNGVYTVPNGYTGYINHWQMSSGTASGSHFCQVSLRATCHDSIPYPGVFMTQDEQGSLNNGSIIALPTPIPIPAAADVKLSAISDAAGANATVMGSIMGWFEKN